MSIDRYYTQIDGKWVRKDMGWDDAGEYIVDDPRLGFETDFWVDISHGRNFLIDERYYFHDLASALEFYLEGWRQRQHLDDEGNGVGRDHKGLYSRGRLIHGHSIHGDAPGHEGESLRQICGARKEDESGGPMNDNYFFNIAMAARAWIRCHAST